MLLINSNDIARFFHKTYPTSTLQYVRLGGVPESGNLNFTMIMNTEDFDADRQTGVILKAVQLQGLKAEKNGRNDLTVEGKKFSGHAYYHHAGRSYHHGTLMMKVDMGQLPKYLNVSPLKLKAKGVQSVQSRVCNLCDFNPRISVADMKDSLREAFCQVYGLPVRELELTDTQWRLLSSIKPHSQRSLQYHRQLPAQYAFCQHIPSP